MGRASILSVFTFAIHILASFVDGDSDTPFDYYNQS